MSDSTETEVTATPAEQAADSIRIIRNTVADETARMAISVPEYISEIESAETAILDTLSNLSSQIEPSGRRAPEMLSAESLYKPLFPSESPTSGLVRLYELLKEYDRRLVNAISDYEEEVPREAEMTLFRRLPYEMDYLDIEGSNIGEIGTALKVALLGKNTKPYTLEQIMALRKVLDFVKKDVSVGERTMMEILSILDDQFGLAGPLAEVEFGG
jgi:hypothetical protein